MNTKHMFVCYQQVKNTVIIHYSVYNFTLKNTKTQFVRVRVLQCIKILGRFQLASRVSVHP